MLDPKEMRRAGVRPHMGVSPSSEPQQRDQELSRERHHHDLARARARAPRGAADAITDPADNRAARLVALQNPGKLYQEGAEPAITGPADPLLAFRAAAAVG